MAYISKIDLNTIPQGDIDALLDTFKNIGMIPFDSGSSNTTVNDLTSVLAERLNKMEYQVISLKLRVYVLEDRVSREEASNVLNMWSSKDPSSRYLAEEIINKFENNEYSI